MADDTKDDKVEEVVADQSQTPEPEVKEEPEEQVELATPSTETVEEPEAAAQEESPEEAPEETPPSRREQLRIQTLLQKYGDPRQTTSRAAPQRSDALDYGQALDADPEVIKQLEADRRAEGQAQYNEGLRRAEFLDWKTSLKIDAPNIEKKYPILDPNDKEHFHPAVADALNQWYLKMSGFDPETQTVTSNGISYADFVESNMELVEEIAGQRNAQTVKNVAQQSAQTGLRPDGSSAKRLNLNQPIEKMSLDELYAASGLPDSRPKK